jgi:hypothetical protein
VRFSHKTVALVVAVEEHRMSLQQAVDEGRLSAAERDKVLDCIEERMRNLLRNQIRLFGVRRAGLLHPGFRP